MIEYANRTKMPMENLVLNKIRMASNNTNSNNIDLNKTNQILKNIELKQDKIAKRFGSNTKLDIEVNDNRKLKISNPQYWR